MEGPLVPELTTEEEQQLEEMKEESKSEFPTAPDYPLADKVEEMKVMEAVLEDPEFYEELKGKEVSFYVNMRDLPDAAAKKYYPDMCRRYIDLERRIKQLEDKLWKLPREDRSVEEDRFEILTELLDKACKGFEIWDEHVDRKLRWGHRLVLEGRLCALIESKFGILDKVCAEFDKMKKGDRDAANNEREWLRYEIRHCDMSFCEIHEKMLKAFLDMDW